MSTREELAQPERALPFWLSLGTIPLVLIEMMFGGWTLILLPLYAWWVVTLLDKILGKNADQPDVDTPEEDLFWYRAITMAWLPLQLCVIYGTIYFATHDSGMNLIEIVGLFFGVGVISGTIGMVYAHELMHQKNPVERWLADLLLASVLYSHFRSEHLLVHHSWVGTPRDAVTARYNEGFHRYFLRVLKDCPTSALEAECRRLDRAGRPHWDLSNPFWRYAGLQLAALLLAFMVGGIFGVILFALQAIFAIWQLELTNYIEHYGLTRRYLGEGKYEHVQPHHSWNASHTASNWLLINLQRHSDHHYKPSRRFPLLQTYAKSEAPQLPLGYPAMTTLAMFPPLWRRRMNPRVRAWRSQFYPDIEDWSPYNMGLFPNPRGSV
ncbi:alkane 1-monooxygenase [Thioclava kandeliae]|uniref:Alkane 1-monooxygenase n=1 Tax=Thioclava kandeliae TaxID=3070818 RepID=A0ABV1SGL3_9RHOB